MPKGLPLREVAGQPKGGCTTRICIPVLHVRVVDKRLRSVANTPVDTRGGKPSLTFGTHKVTVPLKTTMLGGSSRAASETGLPFALRSFTRPVDFRSSASFGTRHRGV
jgi:hypothetical protein